MKKRYAILAAAAAPFVLWGFSSGPDPGNSGVPGELGTCARSGCHLGTPVGTSMSVTTTASGYTPGVAIPITVRITDESVRYGFQATPRLASDSKVLAGTFQSTESTIRIICSSVDFVDQTDKTGTACPANRPLEYIEHSSPRTTNSFSFNFTPAASATGEIVIYAAGNAANGNGTNSGDRIHTATLRLNPAAAGGTRPTINSGGAVTVVNFGGSPAVAPQGWMEIYGMNLAASTADWSSTIGSGTAPTMIGGVEVTIGGKAAFLSFVSPGQVNAQIPDDIGSGPTVLSVTSPGGTSDNFNITVASVTNSFLAPPVAPFKTTTRQFVAALFGDSTASGPFVGSPAESPSYRSARPNDRILIYAIGLGAVTPAQQAGRVVAGQTALNAITLQFGDTPVVLEYAGHTPGQVGLYQLNAVVPNIVPGEYEIRGMINGTPIAPGLFINLK